MNWKNRKADWLLSICINIFFAFTIILYGPFEIFISNTNDFSFTLKDFWWMLAAAALLYVIVATLFTMLFKGIVFDFINLLLFAFPFCCYIQTMFLNGNMRALGNGDVTFSKSVQIGNGLIWLVIITVIIMLRFLCRKNWKQVIKYGALALTAIQLVALVSMLFTTDVLKEEKNGYLSKKGMFEVSSQKNVVVFILDFFDGRTMQSLLEDDAEVLEPLKGFTYFPNATSVHSRTYPSIPYLLTGNMCYFDEEPREYIEESFRESTFFNGLVKNKVNIGLYTYDQYIGNCVKNDIYNYVASQVKLDVKTTVKSMAKVVLYRDMPYFAKNRFLYDIDDLNNEVVKEDGLLGEEKYQIFNDEWFADEVDKNDISVNDNAGSFRFYHLGSCHLGIGDPKPSGLRSLHIVYDYIDKLNQAGVYENTTIIITADHGDSGAGDTLDLPQKTAVPIMIVKPAGKGMQDELTVSKAPVSQTDLRSTIMNGYGFDNEEYGRTIFEIGEQEERERYYYYTALYSDSKGEVELREYKVDGDAAKPESYHFTGSKWDVIKSANKVAAK